MPLPFSAKAGPCSACDQLSNFLCASVALLMRSIVRHASCSAAGRSAGSRERHDNTGPTHGCAQIQAAMPLAPAMDTGALLERRNHICLIRKGWLAPHAMTPAPRIWTINYLHLTARAAFYARRVLLTMRSKLGEIADSVTGLKVETAGAVNVYISTTAVAHGNM